jgi:hypothetical protein
LADTWDVVLGSLVSAVVFWPQPRLSQPDSANPVKNMPAQAIPGFLPIGYPLPREWTRRPPGLPGLGTLAASGRGSFEPFQQNGGTLATDWLKVKFNEGQVQFRPQQG